MTSAIQKATVRAVIPATSISRITPIWFSSSGGNCIVGRTSFVSPPPGKIGQKLARDRVDERAWRS